MKLIKNINLKNNMELKQYIRNTEERFKSYKTLLEEVNKDKIHFPANNPFVEWYKTLLRENKNFEQTLLKKLVEEKTFENEGLNPPFCYK